MDSDLKFKIGNALKEKATQKFSSKVAFANACDVDEKTIRRIFKGEQNLSIQLLKKICDALEIKMSALLIEVGE